MPQNDWISALQNIVGAAQTISGPEVDTFAVDGKVPRAVVFPRTVEETSSTMAIASEAGLKVIPWGAGSQMAFGAVPSRVDLVVALKHLNQMVDHEWGDMTATVQGGMRVEDFQHRLGQHQQFLPLDPPFSDQATVGGLLATNASGPRRLFYGTARDLLIAAKVVHADGTVTKGGAKVVKNVTGYDMNKLYIGSLGTLGIIVEATFRVYPRIAWEKTWLAPFPTLGHAQEAIAEIMDSALVPNALELLDKQAARRITTKALIEWAEGQYALAASVGSVAEEAVDAQIEEIARISKQVGSSAGTLLRDEPHVSFWREVRDITPGKNGTAPRHLRTVLKGGVLISQVAEAFRVAEEAARAQALHLAIVAEAGSGIVRYYVSAEDHSLHDFVEKAASAVEQIRSACVAQEGSLVVLEGEAALKARVDVWGPVKGLKLMQGIKERFDPRQTLNPGRFVGGI
jgi:glycolate oxidase FAD binding subunit